jgi:hypothetical protein
LTGPEDEPNPSVNSDIDSMAGEDDEAGFDDMPVEYWDDCDFEPEDEDEDDAEVYNDDEDEMTDAPNLSQAYAVVATFGLPPNAKIYQNAMIAPSREAAAAMMVYECMKQDPALAENPITGVAVMELTPEWMRSALQGGQPAKVFSVVPPASDQREADPANLQNMAYSPPTHDPA